MPINVDSSYLSRLEVLEPEELIKIIKDLVTGGVAVMFHDKRSDVEIQKRV
jgi:hypothetical protein